jgi:hypothetical protein
MHIDVPEKQSPQPPFGVTKFAAKAVSKLPTDTLPEPPSA